MTDNESAASNVEWVRWGEDDPFWGVASWPGRERAGDRPWTAQEFYALGASDWADFRRRLHCYGAEFDSAVELGCGAGRLTKHMAADFRSVIGVDVSPGMIKTARQHISEPNIEFRLGNGLMLPLDDASVTVAFSTHVFQHFDSKSVARSNFSEIARVLKPGGAMLVHLPTVHPPARLAKLSDVLLAAHHKVLDVRAMIRRNQGAPLMRYLQFPWRWLHHELPLLGLEDVELSFFAMRSNGEIHHCVTAKRAEES